MANNQFRDLHFFAMDSVLPFGMGLINNARTGGFQKIINVFKSKDPFSEFQVDGKSSANKVKDKIDQFIPGLGHPVVSVEVNVEKNSPDHEINDQDSLVATLHRINIQLDQLSHYLNNDSGNIDDR